ncbi:hypothetical protein NKR19_g4515 [Coniochaeta hoffmannii]|uniref:Uncharacterized protein n=1 Tax=Coniochaeta hoffmannii TaxID=91930 RepID=A0AA38VY39_9PEZI|nr:hypothetical protein NKR19_g4515 [Coniochaeta hoffmannii]
MKSRTIAFLSSLLSLTLAAPTHESACAAITSTVTCTVITTTITTTSSPAAACAATPPATLTTSPAPSPNPEGAAAAGVNIQSFTGTLGGPPPPVISSAGAGKRPFTVKDSTFVGPGAALGRSCDVQHNACADAANAGQLSEGEGGGVSACDRQNDECHAFISSSPGTVAARSVRSTRAALDLGSCADTTILFEEGLDGRDKPAFIAANREDFDHGSALNIGVIAGFICQRLESSCKAGADATAACAAASAAAVAAPQDQAAADAFNGVMGGGGAAAVVASSTVVDDVATELAATASAALQTGVVVQTITSCT